MNNHKVYIHYINNDSMKIVINKGPLPFKFSQIALMKLKLLGIPVNGNGKSYNISFFNPDDYRTNPKVIKVVEQLGSEASAEYVKLKVVEIPDNIKWYVHTDNQTESIHEEHRVWQ